MALFGGKASEKKHEVEPAVELGPSASQPAPIRAAAPNDSHGLQQKLQQGGTTVANIGKSIAIKGDLTGNEDMVIEGSVEGTIDLPNNQLTIGANGKIKAEIHAKSVIVIGHVEGDIKGIERVEIHGTGHVEGNVSAPKLVVTEGAQINGTIHMTDAEGIGRSSSPPSQPSSTAPATEVRKTG